MDIRLRIDGWTCLHLSLFLLIVPLKWVIAVVLATLFHEFCHAFAIICSGGSVLCVDVGYFGIHMTVEPMHPAQELICAAAGPVGSLILVFLSPCFQELALCGFCHGVYNLLPLFPMDGGRCLRSILHLIGLEKASGRLFVMIEALCISFLFLLAMYLYLIREAGLLPVFLCVLPVCKRFCRNIPCKDSGQAVQ